ncbi:hypothetical protein ACU4GD_42420 [Cupriavidus basilensis]
MAVVNQGATAGLLLAGLLIPLVTIHWGWRANFMILAAIGAAWSAMWLCVGREGPLAQASDRRPGAAAMPVRLPYRRIFRDPTVLSCLAHWLLRVLGAGAGADLAARLPGERPRLRPGHHRALVCGHCGPPPCLSR